MFAVKNAMFRVYPVSTTSTRTPLVEGDVMTIGDTAAVRKIGCLHVCTCQTHQTQENINVKSDASGSV
jgi:hypothetical protein